MTSPRTPVPDEWARLSPAIRRLTQHNPSVFTGTGTNTFLIGADELWILDPGPDDDAHFELLVAEIGASRVLGVLSTHSHPDHWPMAPRLAGHYDAPTLGFAARAGFAPDRTIADGEVLGGEPLEERRATLEAIHTPGHASDHLCFLFAEEKALFSGDHVMGWSTSVIAPPGGNLNDYMSSLDKLQGYSYSRMHPAHGFPIEDPRGRIEDLRHHRLQRTEQALDALDAGLEEIPAMVDRIYAGIDPKLHQAAQLSLLAHLLALVEQGKVVVEKEGTEPARAKYGLAEETR